MVLLLRAEKKSLLFRNLIHKNVVGFVKHFEDADNIYIVLENCAKKSLVHVLKVRNHFEM